MINTFKFVVLTRITDSPQMSSSFLGLSAGVFLLALLANVSSVHSHRGDHGHSHDSAQMPLASDFAAQRSPNDHEPLLPWTEKYGPQIDQPFSGPLSFSHLPYSRCLEDESAQFDIALLGMPFDTAVTYRPGARFGPHAIRSGSRRQRETRGYTLAWKNNPYELGSKVIDCGDVSFHVMSFDSRFGADALRVDLGAREPVRQQAGGRPDDDGVLDSPITHPAR